MKHGAGLYGGLFPLYIQFKAVKKNIKRVQQAKRPADALLQLGVFDIPVVNICHIFKYFIKRKLVKMLVNIDFKKVINASINRTKLQPVLPLGRGCGK
jgi:hypothetical protein